MIEQVLIGTGAVSTIALAFMLYKCRNHSAALQMRMEELESQYTPIIEAKLSLDDLQAQSKEIEERLIVVRNDYKPAFNALELIESIGKQSAQSQSDLDDLRQSYKEKKAIYDKLLQELAIIDERLALAELGVYEPHFDFKDSEDYKQNILKNRERQKVFVKHKEAVICTTQWAVDGSLSKGQALSNRAIKITLRAFNNECDAAIANTRWNNVNAMEKRILKAKEQIDKLNTSNSVVIKYEYLRLKLEELYLTHEYRERQKAEREERAEAARLAREEQRLLKDQEEAEREEAKFKVLIDKARKEAEKSVGPQVDIYREKIALLEKDLADAHAKVERAQAMAERTRSGYVYIISNIGSFGDGVVKIGLTRRLDPADRVRELGDASVPFIFDTHAIIYSDDAPSLERALHNEFEATRINAQNYRKEFFRASLDEVETAVKRLAPGAPFFKDIEAQEYRETLARRKQALETGDSLIELFPAEL